MKVLIAAPAGYVGRRLLRRLAEDGRVRLRLLVRDARRVRDELHPEIEIVEADRLDRAALDRAVRGIDVAYFPIRFVSWERDFATRSREFAALFRDACIEAGVKRIVCLGVRAADRRSKRSEFLLPEIAEILGACPDRIQTVVIIPGIILSPGSVFYEIVTTVVEKTPVVFLPRWTEARVSPIALFDLVEYLARAASLDARGNVAIAVGEEELTLADLFRMAARVRGLRRTIAHVPVTVPRLSSLILALSTSLSYPMARALVELLREAGDRSRAGAPTPAAAYFPGVTPMSAEDALRRPRVSVGEALAERWTDSLADVDYREDESAMRAARYRDERRQDIGGVSASQVFRSALALGGENGWFKFDTLWRVRGFVDKLLGGFGTSLGRRSPTELRVGDILDVWRVVDLVQNERLLLAAQMNVFGKAWLEFRLQGSTLVQTAYYEPDGALGTLYWYAMLPFHAFIFPDMARNIVERAREY